MSKVFQNSWIPNTLHLSLWRLLVFLSLQLGFPHLFLPISSFATRQEELRLSTSHVLPLTELAPRWRCGSIIWILKPSFRVVLTTFFLSLPHLFLTCQPQTLCVLQQLLEVSGSLAFLGSDLG